MNRNDEDDDRQTDCIHKKAVEKPDSPVLS